MIVGLSGGAAAHELFIADFANNVVRAFNLRTERFVAPAVYTGSAESFELVQDVAYSAEWRTLYVATLNYKQPNITVHSFTRTATGWRMFDQKQLTSDGFNGVLLRVLRDGSVFVEQLESAIIHLCRVQVDRSIGNCIQLTLPEAHTGFDVRLTDKGILLAAALQSGFLSFYRLDAGRAFRLRSKSSLPGARSPLFCGDTLLVGAASDESDMSFTWLYSFSVEEDRTMDRILYEVGDPLAISLWWYVNDSIYAIDSNSKDLFVYL